MSKWIWIIVSVLVVGFVGYQWINSKSSISESASQVRTSVVQKGNLEVKISGSGTAQSVTSEDIKSTIDNDEIDEVLVTVGQEVSAGDELITFTDDSEPITAPADGVITTVSVTAGEHITNGEVVAHLTNYKDLQTVVQVDELDIPKIKTGQPVSLSVSAYPDESFSGKVTEVAEEGTSSNGSSTFAVTIHIDKPGSIKVGMSTEASILTESKEDALYVPVDAIYTNGSDKYVLLASADTSTSFTQQTVKTGIATDKYVELTEGVNEGDTVQLPELSTISNSSSSQD